MKFLHLTDIHFLIDYPCEESGYNSIFKKMTNPLEQLKKGLKQISDYDVVLITGDLVEDGTKEDYKVLKEKLHEILGDIPILITLGNHDVKPAFYEGYLGKDARVEPYNETLIIEDTTIISLDNSHPEYPNGIITKQQCEWLKKTLATCQTEQIILMMHHHLITEQFNMPPAKYEDEFFELIKNSRIDLILCGHTHHAYEGTFAEKLYFTADNLSFSGEDTPFGYVRFEERSGFNYGELKQHQIKIKTIPVENTQKLLGNVTFN